MTNTCLQGSTAHKLLTPSIACTYMYKRTQIPAQMWHMHRGTELIAQMHVKATPGRHMGLAICPSATLNLYGKRHTTAITTTFNTHMQDHICNPYMQSLTHTHSDTYANMHTQPHPCMHSHVHTCTCCLPHIITHAGKVHIDYN